MEPIEPREPRRPFLANFIPAIEIEQPEHIPEIPQIPHTTRGIQLPHVDQALENQIQIIKNSGLIPDFIEFAHNWLIERPNYHNYFNHYYNIAWNHIFKHNKLSEIRIDDPDLFNTVSRGFLLSYLRYINTINQIPDEVSLSFYLFQDGTISPITDNQNDTIHVENEQPENPWIDTSRKYQMKIFKVNDHNANFEFPYFIQSPRTKVSLMDEDIGYYRQDLLYFKEIWLNFFFNYDTVEPKYNDVIWYNETLPVRPRVIVYDNFLPTEHPDETNVHNQREPPNVLVEEEEVPIIEIKLTNTDDEGNPLNEEPQPNRTNINELPAIIINDENYRPLTPQERENEEEIANTLNVLEHRTQAVQQRQVLGHGNEHNPDEWINFNDINKVWIDYKLPAHYDNGQPISINDEYTFSPMYQTKKFNIKKIRKNNIVYLQLEWKVPGLETISNERKLGRIQGTINSPGLPEFFQLEKNPNIFATSLLNKLSKKYGEESFKGKLYKNLTNNIEKVPYVRANDYSSLSFIEMKAKDSIETFLNLFTIINYLNNGKRTVPFVLNLSINGRNTNYIKIPVEPTSFKENVLYGSQYYNEQVLPFFMTLEMIDTRFFILTNLIKVRKNKHYTFKTPGLMEDFDMEDFYLNAVGGTFDEYQFKKDKKEIKVAEHKSNEREYIRIEVQMSFKFAEVHSEDGVLKERVHIKPDYILNRNIYWNSDSFIFLDEYYNLLRTIDIENLDFKQRDVPREHLHLRLPPPVIPPAVTQQQQQQGQPMSEESEGEGEEEEQEEQNEPILNEANIINEYLLDGFDSDEYYEGFNHS